MNLAAMKRAMKSSISEVLEQMFFLPIDIKATEQAAESGEARQKQAMITAGVGFGGPTSGIFMLSIPSDLAASMAVDFLGASSEDLSSDQIAATVKEMINMLAGNALSAYDQESAFNLQIPEIFATSESTQPVAGLEPSVDLCIETPDSHMTFHFNTVGNSKQN